MRGSAHELRVKAGLTSAVGVDAYATMQVVELAATAKIRIQNPYSVSSNLTEGTGT